MTFLVFEPFWVHLASTLLKSSKKAAHNFFSNSIGGIKKAEFDAEFKSFEQLQKSPKKVTNKEVK
jgi:hypothetical protein